MELLVAVAVLMIAASVGVPYLMTGGHASREASAAMFLRRVRVRQASIHAATERFASTFAGLNLDDVGDEGMGLCKDAKADKDATCATLVYNGYIFTLSAGKTGDDAEWKCLAEPVRDRTDARFFFIDRSGVIRYADGSPAVEIGTPLR